MLLVGDERNALDTLAYLLKEYADIEVALSSADSVAVLEALQNTAIDALFLDIEMPVISGIDLCERVKESHPEITIVFTTAYEHYAVQAFQLGALDYLLRPVTRSALRRTVARLRDHCSLLG